MPDAPEAGRLRCLAALAALTGDPADLAAASAVLDAVECPPRTAWVVGADCYLLVARAALAAGDPDRAAAAVEPLRIATTGTWPAVRSSLEELPRQSSSSTNEAARSAPPAATGT